MPQPRNNTQVILNAAGVDAVGGGWFATTGMGLLTVTARFTYSAATLAGALRIRGTNNIVEDVVANEPILSNGVLIANNGGAAITLASGVITLASPAGSQATAILAFSQFPEKILADWDFTSGGGTVSVIVTASGWTV